MVKINSQVQDSKVDMFHGIHLVILFLIHTPLPKASNWYTDTSHCTR